MESQSFNPIIISRSTPTLSTHPIRPHPRLAPNRLVGIGSPVVAEAGAGDVIMALQPGTQSMWTKASSLKSPAPVIGLNAPFSLRCGLAVGRTDGLPVARMMGSNASINQ
jgi:hypothetical protein